MIFHEYLYQKTHLTDGQHNKNIHVKKRTQLKHELYYNMHIYFEKHDKINIIHNSHIGNY